MEKNAIEKELVTSKENVFVSDYKNFSADFRENRKTHCYFISQYTKDITAISSIARTLLDKGCRDFHFCGLQEPLWHLQFDSVYVDLFQDNDGENVALTSGYETLEEFAEELFSSIDYWCMNEDHYLIYDDKEKYIQLLNYWKGEEWKY